MTLMSKAAFAKHIGKSKQYVGELEKFGRLVMDGEKVNADESLRRIELTKDPSKQGVVDRHKDYRDAKENASANTGIDIDHAGQKAGSVYQESKAMREQYNALMAKQDYELRARELLPISDVKQAIASTDSVIRNRLENMPDILSAQLAAEMDENKVKNLLRNYVEETLINLHNTFNQLYKNA